MIGEQAEETQSLSKSFEFVVLEASEVTQPHR